MRPSTYAGHTVDWWVPLALLGLVTAAIAYTSGIAGIRRLGSRVASFVALTEVLAGVAWAWVLLSELPGPVQLVGGLLILAGVVAVKLGERETSHAGTDPSRAGLSRDRGPTSGRPVVARTPRG